jgi:hypothetical protein
LAIFLPFDHSRITGQETVRVKRGIVGMVDLAERTRNPVPTGASLPGNAATIHIDQYIVFIFDSGDHERLPDDRHKFGRPEVSADIDSIDDDLSASVTDEHARDGGFSPSCP